MSSIIYSSHIRAGPSEIYNIAADRANIAKLHSASADIESLTVDNLVVTGTVDFPDGSLQILTSGAGQTLVTQPGGGSLFNDTFSLKSLVAGTDISLVPTNTTLTINASGASAVTLTSAGGQSIVTDGTGPTLQVKGTSPTNLLQDVSTGTVIQFDNKCIRVQDVAGNLPPVGDTAAVGAAANVAVGPLASAGGSSCVAVGRSAAAAQTGSTAVGFNASAADSSATAVGRDSSAAITGAVAVGQLASAAAQDGVAVGHSASAASAGNIAVGHSASASGPTALAVGQSSVASASAAVALGSTAQATAADATAVGFNAQATATGASALGRNTTATANNCTAVGSSADATATSATAVGAGSNASAASSSALGQASLASGLRSVSLGFSDVANQEGAVAVGSNVSATASYSIVIGSSDGATPYVNANSDSVAIGRNVASVNTTYLAAIATPAGGWGITRTTWHRFLDIGTPITANNVVIPAGQVFDRSIRYHTATPTDTQLPLGTDLETADGADPLFWSNGAGAMFYIKNKTGGPITLHDNTGSVILDDSDAGVATLNMVDGNAHAFRVFRSSANNFTFQWMGKLSF